MKSPFRKFETIDNISQSKEFEDNRSPRIENRFNNSPAISRNNTHQTSKPSSTISKSNKYSKRISLYFIILISYNIPCEISK